MQPKCFSMLVEAPYNLMYLRIKGLHSLILLLSLYSSVTHHSVGEGFPTQIHHRPHTYQPGLKIKGAIYAFLGILTTCIKLHHSSNHSGLIEPNFCNVLYFGIIISLIQQICMTALDLASRTKLPHGSHMRPAGWKALL